VYNQRNHKSTTHHTPITRLLCECDLYTPNYDNHPQMKEVMQDFDRQTSHRFEEYEERMNVKRQKCKEQCDKEIQKIILKDKLEKQMTEQLTTLDTKITTGDIPTCVCEKSLADKVEKTCSKCAGVLGGGVTPAWGLISGIVYTGWKAAALAAATKEAIAEGAAKGLAEGAQAGIKAVMNVLNLDLGLSFESAQKMGLVLSATNYKDAGYIYQAIFTKYKGSCFPSAPVSGAITLPGPGSGAVRGASDPICNAMWSKFVYTRGGSRGVSLPDVLKEYVESIVKQAKNTAGMAAEKATQEATTLALKTNTAAVESTYASCQTVIIASVVAILTKKKNEEKTPIYQIIRRIDVMYLVFFDV
ncbi:hypothetical protein PFNF135_06302, partial [Plasmodium falciparum NF135/5.C10]